MPPDHAGAGSTPAWRQFLEDLDARGLKRPEFVIVDGVPGPEAALLGLWGEDLPIQRCRVHKHRNLLAQAPKHMQDELTQHYRDMIYADTGECLILCVFDLAHAVFRYGQASRRPVNIMAS